MALRATSYPTVGQIPGTTTNDNAAAGNVGEFVSSVVTFASPTTGFANATAKDVTSISLTAGDWDVEGQVITTPAGGSTTSGAFCGFSTTTATLPLPGLRFQGDNATATAGSSVPMPLPRQRYSIAVTTTVYLVAQVNYAIGTMGCCGYINARRVR